ncbi:MAG: helix-turn-helix transcriptional regulator [Clostridia bacterium]|nr:helix-turn-helix transcriptional regulator [Clostridia bacterium]
MLDLSNMVITEVRAAIRLTGSPIGTVTVRKNRERWAIAFKQGVTYYRCGGETVRSDARHPVLLPRGSSYEWKCTEPGPCCIIEFESPMEHPCPIAFTAAESNTFLRNFHLIEQAKGQAEAIRRLYDILLSLQAKAAYTPSRKQALLQPAITFMAEHYAHPAISNESLAALCGISTVYFRKCFSAAYGLPPMKYLQDLRIEKAKSLLQSDYSTISQVAESVGFCSIYHFSKMFRRAVGISPREYGKRALFF